MFWMCFEWVTVCVMWGQEHEVAKAAKNTKHEANEGWLTGQTEWCMLRGTGEPAGRQFLLPSSDIHTPAAGAGLAAY